MFSPEEIKSLNELEMSVYNYILNNQQKVIYMKIRDLAEEAHVSTTTVLRFCKKVGCEGYSEFKIKLKFYLQEQREKQPDLDVSVLTDFFRRTEMEAFQKGLEKAADILTKASCIVFIGTGTSGVIGKYGARYFSNVGWFSVSIDDPFTPIYRGENSMTAVVALSVSGATDHSLELARRLKERGCPLISITNTAHCPMAQISDCNLNYYIPEHRLEGCFDITSQVPAIFILEALGQKMMGKK